MDQQVQSERQLASPFPRVIEQPVLWGTKGKERKAEGYKALVNADSGMVYSIVSTGYRLITHEEAIENVEKTLSKYPVLGRYKTETEFYNDGGRMRRTYTFFDRSIDITPGDLVNPVIHLSNSYDTAWPFSLNLGAARLVCSNGLVVREKLFQVRRRHVSELDSLHINEILATAMDRFQKQTEEWKILTTKYLLPDMYEKVMMTMAFGQKAIDLVEKRMEEEAKSYTEFDFPILTLWTFFNILTWYITYRSVSLNHRVEMEKRLRGAMKHFGR